LKSLKLGPLNRLAGGAFGSLKGLLIVLITMQGLPWVESSPHWKQSKFVQVLLPYAPLATELSKDAANEAITTYDI
jgi:membrane protein required for colicin V production